MSTALLHLDRIEKSFAGTQALKPLSLELAAGEVLGLIGENGAGKSTLIKILSGVHRADAGAIHWRGRSSRVWAAAYRRQEMPSAHGSRCIQL